MSVPSYACVAQDITASSCTTENKPDLRFWDLGVLSGSQGLLNLEHLVADVELFVGLQRQSTEFFGGSFHM